MLARLRCRRREPQIDESLALVMAGQVTAGLARGDSSPRAALTAIGVMLRNASDDPRVHETLELAGRITIEQRAGGQVSHLHL